MAVPIVLVAGRDPLSELSGGHSSYVRAHARAALHAGFVPHLICVAPRTETVETDFGVIHRVRSIARPFRQLAIAGHGPALVRAIERFARAGQSSGPLLIHGFGVWGAAAVAAARRLPANLPAVAVVSSYTTYEEESRSKVRGFGGYSPVRQAAFRAEHLWIRLAVERYERRAYLGARRVLLNYDSVRRLIAAKYGPAPRCQKIPYGAESSFRAAGPRPTLPVPLAELLAGAPESGSPPVLVAISRHDPRKGIDVLLHALARLRGEGIAFRACLVGGGPLLGDHRRLAARLGLEGLVALPGAVLDAYAYLQHADLYVLPRARSRAARSLSSKPSRPACRSSLPGWTAFRKTSRKVSTPSSSPPAIRKPWRRPSPALSPTPASVVPWPPAPGRPTIGVSLQASSRPASPGPMPSWGWSLEG